MHLLSKQTEEGDGGRNAETESAEFSLFMACNWSWLILACLPFGPASLNFLPFSTIVIFDYLESGGRWVLDSIQSLFTIEESDFKRFMRNFINKYKRNEAAIADDVEAAAAILGEYTDK